MIYYINGKNYHNKKKNIILKYAKLEKDNIMILN
jgi:hypothetical protein